MLILNSMYASTQTQSTLPTTFKESVDSIIFFIILAVIVLFVVKFIVLMKDGGSRFGSSGNRRDRKSLKGMRELAIKQKLEAELVQNSKASSRYKYEKMASQAGVRIRYGEYKLICLACAVSLPVLTFMFMRNTVLSLAMILIGWSLPGQIISAIRNRRVRILERQVESFMELFVERYKLTQSPSIALEGCLQDLVGQQPLYSELQQTVSEMDTGDPVLEAFQRFAERTANKYLIRMSSSLRMAEDIGTSDAREMLLTKALKQYRNNKSLRNTLKERIEGPKRESMILLLAVPGVVLYQAISSDSYIQFMLHSKVGKIGCAFVLLSCMGCIWFINKKIGAPLD